MTINDFTFDWEPYENTSVAIQLYPIEIPEEEIDEGKQKLLVLDVHHRLLLLLHKKLKCGDCNEQIVSISGNVDDF